MGPKILSQKMDIGDIRLREVIDVEDNKNQVLSNSNMQASGSYDQNEASGSHDQNEASTMMTKCKINNKWLVHHLNQMSNKVQAIKFK
jgi:hypothetical protein